MGYDWSRLPGPIDLHAHSNESDGTATPASLVEQAAAAGLGAIAITDHDTTAGWASAAAQAERSGIVLIPGVEFSSQYEYASVHVLGYLLDPDAPAFLAERDRVRHERLERATRMVERIGHDYPLTWQHVVEHSAPGATIGRPHIADALVTLGIVPDRSAAFEGILHWRGGYYQPHLAPTPVEAIRIIREAGGVPVIAHPAGRGRPTMREGVLASFVEAGLFGLEVDHRDNPPESRVRLRAEAEAYGLVVTGSSDWHGTGKPNLLGEHTTSPESLAAIVNAASGSAPIVPTSLVERLTR